MDQEESEDLKILIRTALADTDKVFGAHWSVIRKIPVFTVKESVALSIDLDPLFADVGFVTAIIMCARDESPFDDEDIVLKAGYPALAKRMAGKLEPLETFLERYLEASANIEPYGELPIVEKADKPEDCKVRLTDFATWAKVRGWRLPENFPCTQDQNPKEPEKPAANAWKQCAREIGIAIYKENNKLSVDKIASKVHEEMTRRHKNDEPYMIGRGDKIPSAETIKRHALTGLKSSSK